MHTSISTSRSVRLFVVWCKKQIVPNPSRRPVTCKNRGVAMCGVNEERVQMELCVVERVGGWRLGWE